jgi:hypothetical protein
MAGLCRARLDKKTFDDVIPKDGETDAQARERFLCNVYDGLATGIHINGQAEPTGTAPWFEGTSNIAQNFAIPRASLTGHFVADPALYLGNGFANLLRSFVPIWSASLIGASVPTIWKKIVCRVPQPYMMHRPAIYC